MIWVLLQTTTVSTGASPKRWHVTPTPVDVQPGQTVEFTNHSTKFPKFEIVFVGPSAASPGDILDGNQECRQSVWRNMETLRTTFDTLRRQATTLWTQELFPFGLAPAAVVNKGLKRADETLTHPLRSCKPGRRLVRHHDGLRLRNHWGRITATRSLLSGSSDGD